MKIINRRQQLRQDSVIFIDSQSAIKFLIYLALILECLKSLNEMVLHSNMDIPWHPLSWRIRTNLCKRINRRYLFKQDKAIFRDSRICNKVPNRCYCNGGKNWKEKIIKKILILFQGIFFVSQFAVKSVTYTTIIYECRTSLKETVLYSNMGHSLANSKQTNLHKP